eukprot:7387541-Prymnesium_polylepis.1
MPVAPTTYSADPQLVNVSGQEGYISPSPSSGFLQALVTDLGFACIGSGVRPALCASGTQVFDPVTGNCADGSIEMSQGASAPVPCAPSPRSTDGTLVCRVHSASQNMRSRAPPASPLASPVCVAPLAGAEFDFTFVTTGTTTKAPDFDYQYYMSFYDVDGGMINDGTGTDKPFFELISIMEATE